MGDEKGKRGEYREIKTEDTEKDIRLCEGERGRRS